LLGGKTGFRLMIAFVVLLLFVAAVGYFYFKRTVPRISEHEVLPNTTSIAVAPGKSDPTQNIASKGNDGVHEGISVVAKVKASRKSGFTPDVTRERKEVSPRNTQVAGTVQLDKKSNITQNIAPEEMWRRVVQCVFPAQATTHLSHAVGTVSVGLRISPDGEVTGYRVLDGEPVLQVLALDAMARWKFRPNVVQGVATYSRIRALLHFNADGTTSIDFARALVPNDLGDTGTPEKDSTTAAVPRPPNSPQCSSSLPGIGAPK
jgi:TonB family protein